MPNLSERTRKQQILDALIQARGNWVDGSKLATEEVGGSEGLRRLRELRASGYKIEERRHPDPRRDIWQYRYAMGPRVSPLRDLTEEAPVDVPQDLKFTTLPSPIVFGNVAVCGRCRAKTRKYFYEGLEELRHKDPFLKKQPCIGCNGWGIVPNRGAIPITMPEGML